MVKMQSYLPIIKISKLVIELVIELCFYHKWITLFNLTK